MATVMPGAEARLTRGVTKVKTRRTQNLKLSGVASRRSMRLSIAAVRRNCGEAKSSLSSRSPARNAIYVGLSFSSSAGLHVFVALVLIEAYACSQGLFIGEQARFRERPELSTQLLVGWLARSQRRVESIQQPLLASHTRILTHSSHRGNSSLRQ